MKKVLFMLLLFALYVLPVYAQSPAEQTVTGEWTNPLSEPAVTKELNRLGSVQTQSAVLPDKALQEAIEAAIQQRDAEFTVSYDGSFDVVEETIEQSFQAAMSNNEYVHYDLQGYGYSARGYNGDIEVTFTVLYYQSAEQVAYVEKAVQQIAAELTDTSMSDHEKVKALHDYVVLNVRYDETLNQGVNAPYFALTGGETLCNGYAMLMYLLLEEVAIPVRLVSGYAGDVAHAWNLVQLDGEWYHLDATWDDPVPDKEGRVLYDYYMVSDDVIQADHKWQTGGLDGGEKPYPEADADYVESLLAAGNDELLTGLNLHLLTDAYTADSYAEAVAAAARSFRQSAASFSFRFVTDSPDVQSELRALLQEAGSVTNAASSSYSFQDVSRTPEQDYIVTVSAVEYNRAPLSYPFDGYKTFGEKTGIAPNHEWTVRLSQSARSVNDQYVYIIDEYGQKQMQVIEQTSPGVITISPPETGYKRGATYYMLIENAMQNQAGKQLKQPISFSFTIAN